MTKEVKNSSKKEVINYLINDLNKPKTSLKVNLNICTKPKIFFDSFKPLEQTLTLLKRIWH